VSQIAQGIGIQYPPKDIDCHSRHPRGGRTNSTTEPRLHAAMFISEHGNVNIHTKVCSIQQYRNTMMMMMNPRDNTIIVVVTSLENEVGKV
jgi:hypothetical protein